MSERKVSPAAQAAAEWWAEQVGAPVFRQVQPEARTASTDFTEVALSYFADQAPPVDDAMGQRFVAALATRIDAMLKRGAPWNTLVVDYGPDRELAKAAEVAGIHRSRFPIKTGMNFTTERVIASLGYHGRWTLVWASPEWNRPRCGYYRYPNGSYGDPADEVCTRPQYHDGECGDWIADPKRCGACGGTYSEHFSAAAYQDPKRCREWFEKAA